jgi:hypothetical protein
MSRAPYDGHSGISGWPVRAAARHGHDEVKLFEEMGEGGISPLDCGLLAQGAIAPPAEAGGENGVRWRVPSPAWFFLPTG